MASVLRAALTTMKEMARRTIPISRTASRRSPPVLTDRRGLRDTQDDQKGRVVDSGWSLSM
eukprot:2656249-Prymnesium_polylepis.1